MSELSAVEKRVDFELIRAIAIAAVVFIHVASPVVNNYGESSSFSWFLISIIDALMRWCVPVFIMVSGALVLTKDESPQLFYRKRLGRIGWPLVFWFGMYWLTTALVAPPAKTFQEMFHAIVFEQPYLHFYFLFIMLELALITPWLRRVVRSLTDRSLALLTALFLYIGVAYMTKTTFVLYLFIPYIGYYLYGFYVKDRTLNSRISKQITIAVVALLAVVTVWLRYLIIQRTLVLPGIVNSLDILAYLSPTMLLISLLMFLLLKDPAIVRRVMQLVPKKTIIRLGEASFGIYLIHPILQLMQGAYFPNLADWQMHWTIVVTFGLWIGLFSLSWLFVWLLRKNRFTKKLV